MDPDKLGTAVRKAFKSHGLYLQQDASDYVLGSLSDLGPSEVKGPLKSIVSAIDRDDLANNIVSLTIVKEAVSSVLREMDNTDDNGDVQSLPLEIIDIFEVPKMTYDPDRKHFLATNKYKELYPDGQAKAAMFKDRYQSIQQRLSRNPFFMKPVIVTADAAGVDTPYCEIIPIDSLKSRDTVGSHGDEVADETVFLLAMLIEYEEKRYHLQDLSGHVRCDLEYAETTTGMFTEQCIVLAEGVYANNIFHVKVLAHPPPEKASVTRDIFRDIDLFGGERHRKELDKLAVKEKTLENTFFVILSDVWLDNESVRTKLKDLFAGYMHAVPDAFIFIGSFSEKTYGADHPRRVREGLSNLGSMIRQHQSLINVPCIFVPSAADPPGGDLLPRKPLPPAITKDIREKLPNCRFVSNPCRIRWYSQEIVIYREDVTAKMQRHCLVPLDTRETDAVHKHLVRTLMDQAHLSPLPGRLRPLQIGYEHTMRLYPHPDVLIIADKHESYDIHYEDALCFNPGSFYQSGFSFVAYWPAAKTVEPSSLS